jgi:hypothetical protein
MAPDAAPGSEPAAVATAQADLSVGAGTGLSEEIVIRVGTTTTDASGSAGYDVGIFYKDSTGCIERYQAEDGSALVLPIRAGGAKVSGLVCAGTARSQYLVRTSAVRKSGSQGAKGYYSTVDERLALAVDADGAPILPAQLVTGTSAAGSIKDTGTATSPLVRYDSVAECAQATAD